MGRLLQRVQTAAADRTRFVQHPRVYRVSPAPKPGWIDAVFKWGLFGWLMWMIWAPVALLFAVVLMIVL